MMGPNMCFKGVIWKIIPKLSLLPLPICGTATCTYLSELYSQGSKVILKADFPIDFSVFSSCFHLNGNYILALLLNRLLFYYC